MTDLSNPLLDRDFRVPFHRIEPDHIGPAVATILDRAQRRIEALGEGRGESYEEILGELDAVSEDVVRTWAPISHLNNVDSTAPLREAYAAALPEVTQFWSRLLNDDGVFRRLKQLEASPEAGQLDALRSRHLTKTLREFRRAGAELSPSEKESLEKIRIELSELSQKFGENILDETAAFKRVVTDSGQLAGLPETALERAAQLARDQGEEGWLLTLDMPSVQAVLKHADDRALRRDIHTAYMVRCTDGERDNRPIIERILELRRELADILGFPDFPDYRLELAMAGSGARVREFLDELIEGTRPFYERDEKMLASHGVKLGLDALDPWDVSYVMEKVRKERFDLDDEALRPWFPLEEVQSGLFEIARTLFGLQVTRADNEAVWHPDVGFFEVRDQAGVHLGSFYTDWFPREVKRQGAWMDTLVSGGPTASGFDPHLGFIGGNFNPPTASKPSLLTHREVQTLFHEFGHLLHHTTSRVEVRGRAGINVAWDWVEVPSQLMENWTWERQALDLFAHHYQTGETLPEETLDRLLSARRFMGGWMQMRQLSFANLDLRLHRDFRGDGAAMDYARQQLRPFVPSDRFVEHPILPSFSHLFAGGYASAYYSYLWSEALEADAFSRFAEEGVLNPDVGRDFLESVLSQGDRRDPEELFREFMGRDPDPGALIRRNLGDRPS